MSGRGKAGYVCMHSVGVAMGALSGTHNYMDSMPAVQLALLA